MPETPRLPQTPQEFVAVLQDLAARLEVLDHERRGIVGALIAALGKLGGEMRLTPEELARATDPDLTIEAWDEPETQTRVFRVSKTGDG